MQAKNCVKPPCCGRTIDAVFAGTVFIYLFLKNYYYILALKRQGNLISELLFLSFFFNEFENVWLAGAERQIDRFQNLIPHNSFS